MAGDKVPHLATSRKCSRHPDKRTGLGMRIQEKHMGEGKLHPYTRSAGHANHHANPNSHATTDGHPTTNGRANPNGHATTDGHPTTNGNPTTNGHANPNGHPTTDAHTYARS